MHDLLLLGFGCLSAFGVSLISQRIVRACNILNKLTFCLLAVEVQEFVLAIKASIAAELSDCLFSLAATHFVLIKHIAFLYHFSV